MTINAKEARDATQAIIATIEKEINPDKVFELIDKKISDEISYGSFELHLSYETIRDIVQRVTGKAIWINGVFDNIISIIVKKYRQHGYNVIERYQNENNYLKNISINWKNDII